MERKRHFKLRSDRQLACPEIGEPPPRAFLGFYRNQSLGSSFRNSIVLRLQHERPSPGNQTVFRSYAHPRISIIKGPCFREFRLDLHSPLLSSVPPLAVESGRAHV